jgi:hypothetical protein
MQLFWVLSLFCFFAMLLLFFDVQCRLVFIWFQLTKFTRIVSAFFGNQYFSQSLAEVHLSDLIQVSLYSFKEHTMLQLFFFQEKQVY